MLKIEQLSKIYQNNKGIHNLSISLNEGEILGIIGPNGSGKSTTLDLVAGIKKSDFGKVTLDNVDTSDCTIKAKIGYLEECPFLYAELTIIQFINFVWGIKFSGIKNDEVYRLLDKFELIEFQNYKIKELSMGLRQRVSIIIAIMNYPKLVILDEPTNALDTKSILMLKEEIFCMSKMGCIIIISSHMLDFIQNVVDIVLFIKEGNEIDRVNAKNNVNLDLLYKSIYLN